MKHSDPKMTWQYNNAANGGRKQRVIRSREITRKFLGNFTNITEGAIVLLPPILLLPSDCTALYNFLGV